MTAASIIADVKAALREAGAATGNGPLVASLQPTLTGSTPWATPGTLSAAVEVVAIVDMFNRHEIDGARILSGDKKVMLEPGEVVPKVGDLLSIEGRSHRLEQVWPLSPAGEDLLYVVQAREV